MLAYKLTCVSTGKIYIGITRYSVRRRFMQHLANARRGVGCALYAAMRVHAEWEAEEIAEATDWSALLVLERELIAQHRSTDPEVGYNSSSGGQGTLGFRFKKNKDQIERSAKHHRGKFASAETRRLQSEAMRRRWRDNPERFKTTSNWHRDAAIAAHYFSSPSFRATGAAFGIGGPAAFHAVKRARERIAASLAVAYERYGDVAVPTRMHSDWLEFSL